MSRESAAERHAIPLRPLPDGASPAQVAQAAVAMWGIVHDALSPVIGPGGVAALYKRTLHLSREAYPWLGAAYDDAVVPGDFTSLRAALSNEDSKVAAAAHDAMLQTLHDLLARLIGPSLTSRLLPGIWPSPPTGPAAPDPSP